ncbi:hypothetical protein ES702_05089 [subsurface metagenome]
MASGLPDYKRGVDIFSQTLADLVVAVDSIPRVDVDILAQSIAELTTRPKYGAAQLLAGEATMTGMGEASIGSVSGKGMIYGGLLYLSYTSTQIGSIPVLRVEGVSITDLNISDLNQFGVYMEHAYPFYMRTYDNVNFLYCMGISGGITFETGFEILYTAAAGGLPAVYCKVIYALI